MSDKSVVPASDEIWSILKRNFYYSKRNKEKFKRAFCRSKRNQPRFKKAKELFETPWGRLMESLVEGIF